MKVKCIDAAYSYFTKDKIYEVFLDNQLNPYVNDDTGGEYDIGDDTDTFEVIQGDNLDLKKSYSLQKPYAMNLLWLL